MPAPASPLTDSRQLVRVLAADWNSPHAMLQRYTRIQAAAAWQPLGDALPVFSRKKVAQALHEYALIAINFIAITH